MSWTAERVELLTKLWADGLSASQIAGELGNVTRNAVIGKVHRLGLSGRTKSGGAAPKPKKAATSTTKTASPVKASVSEPVSPPPTAPISSPSLQPTVAGATALKVEPVESIEPELETVPTPEVVIPVSERATILTLTERTCKWPIGDPGSEDFYFCGRQSDAGTPYCAHHRTIAYQPVSDRRRDRKAS